jgi:probable F420-dependent oxidoreductase
MRVGVDIPYFASPNDIRDYVREVEAMGFDHVGFSEHVACTLDSPFPAPMFTFDEPWRESFTLASYVAALTTRIEINPAMVLLPLYPPVLAAKQAAEVDNLSEGRLRIAASVGWNVRECETLGIDPATRAQRFEEQVVVLRRLWGERAVTHSGEFFELRDAGISARPAAQIPIWFGAGRMDQSGFPAKKAIERAGRLADGFKFAAPTFFDLDRVAGLIGDLKSAVATAGRNPDDFGIEVRIIAQATTAAEWPGLIERIREIGATHVGFSNRIAGGGVSAQLEIVEQFVNTTKALW